MDELITSLANESNRFSPGTGSSVVSGSENSEVSSDFESDSGVEVMVAEVVMTTSPSKKELHPSVEIVSDKDGCSSAFVSMNGTEGDGSHLSSNEQDCTRKQVSCDHQIDSIISCIDYKVSTLLWPH